MRNSFRFTSIEDTSAFRQLDAIGTANVMLESDYPHYDSSWPQTQPHIRRQIEHLDDKTIRMLCYENAARLYRHVPPPASWLERSVVGAPSASTGEAGTWMASLEPKALILPSSTSLASSSVWTRGRWC
jgi:hypothetical protein